MNDRILFVDDDQAMCDMVDADFQTRGIDVICRTTAAEAMDVLGRESFATIITDLNMPGTDGIELCRRIVKNRPNIPVIVITAFGSLENAVLAMRAGAYDFVTKPFELDVLALTIERAVEHHRLRATVRELQDTVARSEGFGEIIGASGAMQRLYDRLSQIADVDATVLITGESGTGKELVARALHKQSRRCDGAFVPINCAAIPEQLLESELFGHTGGAFTDARSARKGLFVRADKGTLFLDEIAEFPLLLQPKLLRALEERTIRPVGGDKEVALDFRLVAATNRDLEDAMEEKGFREDLYYRVSVICVELPPLRARGTDVLLLAQHFLEECATRNSKKVNGLSQAVAERLLAYAWPGNVRELRNVMEHAVALTSYEQITVDDLPQKMRDYEPDRVVIGSDNPDELVTLEEIERRYILHVLDAAGGNKSIASRILGLDRKTLYRKLDRIKSRANGKGS